MWVRNNRRKCSDNIKGCHILRFALIRAARERARAFLTLCLAALTCKKWQLTKASRWLNFICCESFQFTLARAHTLSAPPKVGYVRPLLFSQCAPAWWFVGKATRGIFLAKMWCATTFLNAESKPKVVKTSKSCDMKCEGLNWVKQRLSNELIVSNFRIIQNNCLKISYFKQKICKSKVFLSKTVLKKSINYCLFIYIKQNFY